MWWTNPWWLLALVLIIPLFAFSGISLNYRKSAGQFLLKRLTILRAAAIIAVILALAGTYILVPTRSRQLVMLFDASASIGEVQAEHSRNVALKIIKDLKPGDRVSLVAFAGQPSVITPWVNSQEATMILESTLIKASLPEQTDLQAALRVAFQLFKGKSGNRSILLFSDGHPTTGGAVTKILVDIRNSGIVIDTIPMEMVSHGLVARELTLPELVHPGERMQTQWKVIAGQPQSVTVLVKIDGKLIYRAPFSFVKGENTISLPLTPQDSGIHRVEVAAEAFDGKLIPPASSGGLLQVSGPARILVVHGNSTSALSQALAIQGMKVNDGYFSQLPDTAEGFNSYGAIVLDNVPALYITEKQRNLLQSYVAGGGGLLVIGGDASLGRGDYYATGLEDILPVQTNTRQCDLIQEGRFEPVVRTYTPDLSGLEYRLPPVKGYLLTKPKNLATVYLVVGKGDPLLAGWRYGNGQVAVFTSDSGRRWLASWSGTPVYNRLWSQLIRSIERTNRNEGLRVLVKAEAASAQIVVEALGPDQRLRPGLSLTGFTGSGPDQITFLLKETASGRYEANVPLAGSGIQQFNIYDRQSNDWNVGWVWNPPGAEFAALGPDRRFLGYLSDITGGVLSTMSAAGLPKLHWAWKTLNLQGWLVVIALLLFLVELGYRSTSLGQFAIARTLPAAWWAVLVRLANMFRGVRTPEPEAAGGEEQNSISGH